MFAISHPIQTRRESESFSLCVALTESRYSSGGNLSRRMPDSRLIGLSGLFLCKSES